MNINDQHNISFNSLTTIFVKFVFLFLGVLIGLTWIFLYFNLFHMMAAVFAALSFAISAALFSIHRRLLIYSLLALITGILLTAVSVILGYSATVSASVRATLTLTSCGLLFMACGLAIIGFVIAMLDMNKADFWAFRYKMKHKYPKFSIIMFSACGIVFSVEGIYLFALGLRQL